MQITTTLLNIPPYISTTWDHIAALRTERDLLIITMKNGETTSIPKLSVEVLNQIFAIHAEHVQNKAKVPFTFSLPLRTSNNNEELASFASMNHVPEDSTLPDIPAEILEKIAILTKAFGGDLSAIAEPFDSTCNCTFCQIARAIRKESQLLAEETVDDEDLTFRDWQIDQLEEKLYRVTSPIDGNEQYRVFLGQPLGCTCGLNHCEHIKAVLQT